MGSTLKFLQKAKNQEILKYLKKGLTYYEISKIANCSFATINKVKSQHKEFQTTKSEK